MALHFAEVLGWSDSTSCCDGNVTSSTMQLIIPSTWWPTVGDHSFTVAELHTWNELPETLQRLSSPLRFQWLFFKFAIFSPSFHEITTSYCEVLLKWLVMFTVLYKLSKIHTHIHSQEHQLVHPMCYWQGHNWGAVILGVKIRQNIILKYRVAFDSEYTVTFSTYLEITAFAPVFGYCSSET